MFASSRIHPTLLGILIGILLLAFRAGIVGAMPQDDDDTTGAAPEAPDTTESTETGRVKVIEAPSGKAIISISDDAIQVKEVGEDGVEKEVFRLEVDKEAFKESVEDAIDAMTEGLQSGEDWGEGMRKIFGPEWEREDYELVGRDIFKFAGNYELGAREKIHGDIVIISGDLRLLGRVTGNVFVLGGTVDLGPRTWVNGDLAVVFGNIKEDRDSQIDGETIQIASLGGDGFLGPNFPWYGPPIGGSPYVRFFVVNVVKFVVLLILALIIYMFLRDRLIVSKESLAGQGFKCFGIGFVVSVLGLIAWLCIVVVLCITLIGIPLALLLVFAGMLFALISYLVAAFGLGEVISRKFHFRIGSPFVVMIVGLLLLHIFGFLGQFLMDAPFLRPLGISFHLIGIMINLVALIAGVGALVTSRFGGRLEDSTLAAS